MKKVLLTTALLLSFAFTYANDTEKKSDVTAEPKDEKEIKKVEAQVQSNATMPVCYLLSCGQWCDMSPDASFWEWLLGVETVYNILEAVECGNSDLD